MARQGNLIVFTGPSGVGKGTVVKRLFEELDEICFSVSATTRKQRVGEEEGVNYFYKSRAEFEQMISSDKLLEWAEFVGNYYGTPRDFVEEMLESGKDVFLEIEVQGALQVIKSCKPVTIFLLPPSFEELESRLRNRGTEDEETLQRRLAKAREEMKETDQFKYKVINDDVEAATEKLKAIILAERIKV